jgi:ADP-ribose pyrophosphatase YjhB (NUDIX family)
MPNVKKAGHLLAFKDNKREILLTQRNDIPMWVLPGGYKEPNEPLKEAVVREVKEETGYEGKITNLAAVYESKDGKIEKYLYIGEIVGGAPKTSPETRRIEWFNIEKLPLGLTLYERQRIRDCLNFEGNVICREYRIDYFKELLNQLKHPLFFLFLLFNAIKDKIS